MEKKKYLFIFWNSLLLILLIVCFAQLFYVREHDKPYRDLSEFATTNPLYKSINVIYNNEEYHILSDENSLYFEINRNRSSDNKITSFSSRDIIFVDSITLNRLKNYVVIPQPRIDSIYNQKGLTYMLDMFFVDNIPKVYMEDDTLSAIQNVELNYVMDILIRQGFIIFCDCETGIPTIYSSNP